MSDLFGAYAFHQQEIEDAIELFLNGAESVEFDDDMSDEIFNQFDELIQTDEPLTFEEAFWIDGCTWYGCQYDNVWNLSGIYDYRYPKGQ